MPFPRSAAFPALAALIEAVLGVWPEHAGFLEKSLGAMAPADAAVAEDIAGLMLELVGDERVQACRDYRWTCELLLEEEMHFRRTGRYRLASFAEAAREVYDDAAFMRRYMNGLLLSQALWSNHRGALAFYAARFLDGNGEGFDHLEIGPGHGLYLSYAARHPRCATATGWDASAAGVAAARRALDKLGAAHARVEERDVTALGPAPPAFDSVVVSEVLEHLEDPAGALANLRAVMRPGGRLFVNMPVNSPAPDHIYLLDAPEAVAALVERAGFAIEEWRFFPATGYTLERARKAQATISCAIVARRDR